MCDHNECLKNLITFTDGTTDVTRTVHFGQPSTEQIEAYTRVLMASIDLASFTFPQSLKLNQIDVIARAPLWDFGYDYKHGTSHGIGVFLKVHERKCYGGDDALYNGYTKNYTYESRLILEK